VNQYNNNYKVLFLIKNMATVESSVENETPSINVIDLKKRGAELIENIAKKYKDCRVMISSPILKKYKSSLRFGLDSEKNRKPLYDGIILSPSNEGFIFRLFDENSSRVFINPKDLRRLLVVKREKGIPIEMTYYIN
jgi:hypothetical protein